MGVSIKYGIDRLKWRIHYFYQGIANKIHNLTHRKTGIAYCYCPDCRYNEIPVGFLDCHFKEIEIKDGKCRHYETIKKE